MKHHIIISILIVAALAVPGIIGGTSTARAQEASQQKAILVTGASTGIGRNITETLAAEGYYVYAGARKAEDLQALDAIENVQSVRLDVTVPEDIEAAVQTITNEGRGLYGLVNNAGVLILDPLIEVEEDDLDFIFDVNIYGVYRVTRAFSPLLIKAKGRISNIGSISGLLSGPMGGPYSMSKHAIEAYTDALSGEMEKLGVKVSVIEPGNYKSNITSSTRLRREARDQTGSNSQFSEEIEALADELDDRSQYKEPDDVTTAVMHALFDDNPKLRYLVVPNQREAEITIKRWLRKLVQLNQDHPFSYDRDELVAMLDEALAAAE